MTLPRHAKDVPGWPGYKAGTDGSVWSCRVKGILREGWHKLTPQGRKYKFLCLCNGPVRSGTFYVHHIVLLTHVGPRPDGMEAIHKNDVQSDNRLRNLKWGTHIENCKLRLSNGKQTFGEDRKNSKLNNEKVAWIRANPDALDPAEMARRLKVRTSTVLAVARGESWRHLLPKK